MSPSSSVDWTDASEATTGSTVSTTKKKPKSENKPSSSSSSGVWDSLQQSSDVKKRTATLSLFILIAGMAASFAFLYLGITSASFEEQDKFNRHADEVTQELDSSWNDYEVAGLWIHEACRSRNITRQEFRELYLYIRSFGGGGHGGGGLDDDDPHTTFLDFQAAEFIPNVTHSERLELEVEANAYFKSNYPSVIYGGFRGFEPDPENLETGLSVQNRSEQDFYFPVQYVEPVEPNAAAIDFDLYSSASRRATIHEALDSWKAALTARLRLVQETDPSAYSVLLMHPGIPLQETNPNSRPRDVSLMVIRIPSLLERTARFQTERGLGVYIYDVTPPPPEEAGSAIELQPQFLGAANLLGKAGNSSAFSDDDISSDTNPIQFEPEVEYMTLVKQVNDYAKVDLYEEELQIASKTWRIVVVPMDGSYEPEIGLVLFAGVMIFVASAGLAICLMHNIRRGIQMNEILRQGEIERAIVSSLFPSTVRDRLMAGGDHTALAAARSGGKIFGMGNGKSMGEDATGTPTMGAVTSENIFGSKPIADLFPETTVMFADLVGFTAWSSVRDPTQVFTLLESIYHAFDVVAHKLGVFKVETIGDCYVAVCGLPDPNKDHAVVMAQFAAECQYQMDVLTKTLDTTLGPDTCDLDIRVGLHSGPVTAGVLRGDKGRFQLFGDTVNTASRMESTSARGRIQVSGATAALLEAAGKGLWSEARSDSVVAKGKGKMKTFWLVLNGLGRASSLSRLSATSESTNRGKAATSAAIRGSLQEQHPSSHKMEKSSSNKTKEERLIQWNVDVLSGILKKIQARRMARANMRSTANVTKPKGELTPFFSNGALDEVKDIIKLPKFDGGVLRNQVDPDSIQLDTKVAEELREYVTQICSLYPIDNPFHGFEHASHVLMSTTKLLSRIVNPKEAEVKDRLGGSDIGLSDIHDHTYGITSDPTTQFACVFGALIHDVDHPGVPNMTLVAEETQMARKYRNKSVAEQNSIDISWNLLMEGKFDNLRGCIAVDQNELQHFRQLLVNIVMATDIMDKSLGALRTNRWDRAFSGNYTLDEVGDVNLKATIVIEHLIQASDVAHTMQHWHVYLKWNERLFHEMYSAYLNGRLEKDPSKNWVHGELSFFDYYIIPLAKKLDTCGVFGVSSTEFLNYASTNRQEWETKGEAIVDGYLKKYDRT